MRSSTCARASSRSAPSSRKSKGKPQESRLRSLLGRRQAEVEAGALADLATRPHLAAVAPHDAARRGEADPGARKIVAAVQPLEQPEQALGEAHVEAVAVVAHEEGALSARMADRAD